MSADNPEALARLTIAREKKARRRAGPRVLIGAVAGAALVGAAVFFATHTAEDKPGSASSQAAVAVTAIPVAAPTPSGAGLTGDVVLTVSGYIIPHERIEISPRFMGTVKWIGVKKGDQVRKGDVMVLLEDEEYRARLVEAAGRVALAEANLTNAVSNLQRQVELATRQVDSAQALDEARRARDAAAAEFTVACGQRDLARTWLEWCTIRAPITGTILEKLAEAHELVVPQSFGGSRGPSTALVSLADLNDLQIEIDLNEADTPRVRLNQRCRVSPEAYPSKQYAGRVVEIAPEANRQKGTLQVKVQVDQPDRYLTPELTAKVDFLKE